MKLQNRFLMILLGGLSLSATIVSNVSAQVANNQIPNQVAIYKSVPSGARMKFQGVVIERNADTFTIRDRTRTDYQVRITDSTSVKTNGGFLHGGKKYPVTDLLRGLIVEVEGRGDAQGEIVADKIRFNESDMRAAVTSDARVTPVEENQKKMAGQMDELYAVAQEARQQVAQVNERVSSLDEFDVQDAVAVTFRVNSAVLSPDAKRQLDDFAKKALASSGYMIEVSGHTDSTGSVEKNMRLSRDRAEAVVEYLTVTHKLPARRFITPMGYGKSEAVADNSTPAGRAQNRRVEVKILANRGLRTGSAKTSSERQ
ncbi:MAG TPA: OmpA family protein [Pyrinomonadaceae bacterium]|jgi:outer membrane protein OmpA-like peptidoglycan-associated protein|nr:OmpA family protein [Pyrinomonadaceae bacterium]